MLGFCTTKNDLKGFSVPDAVIELRSLNFVTLMDHVKKLSLGELTLRRRHGER